MPLNNMLLEEEMAFQSCNNLVGKLNHINNIINLKLKINSSKYNNYIYKDIKVYIDLAIRCLDISLFEYESINRKNIEKMVGTAEFQKQASLYKFLARKLRDANLPDDEAWAHAKAKTAELQYLLTEGWLSSNPITKTFKIILCLSSISLLSICISLLMLYILVSLVLYPSVGGEYFKINYHPYFHNVIGNHLANTLSLFLDFKNDLKVDSRGGAGFMLQAAFKVLTFVLVFNYAYKQLEKRMNK